MEGSTQIPIYIAFLAGFLSFISPCVLPLVPSYISYITGLSVEELSSGDSKRMRRITLSNSAMFITGFSTVFVAFGASATFAGNLLLEYQGLIRNVGGLLIIIFGLYILGFIKLDFLAQEKKIHFKTKPAGLAGSFLVGIAFAAGWTPCVGPILGTILLYASTSDSVSTGVILLATYSLGLGLPLFLIALGINKFLTNYRKLSKHMWIVSKVSGSFLLLVGILVMTDSLTIITAFLSKYNIGIDLGELLSPPE